MSKRLSQSLCRARRRASSAATFALTGTEKSAKHDVSTRPPRRDAGPSCRARRARHTAHGAAFPHQVRADAAVDAVAARAKQGRGHEHESERGAIAAHASAFAAPRPRGGASLESAAP